MHESPPRAAAGVVEEIFVTAEGSEDVARQQSVTLVKGKGIQGDRYFGFRGTYSRIFELGRQLTLISADSAEEALDVPAFARLGVGDLRRNVVIRGMSQADLIASVGGELELGGACRVLVHRPCPPCPYLERRIGVANVREATWYVGGVNCEILEGGSLAVGDPVRARAGAVDSERCDWGGKLPEFFILPSAREGHATGAPLAEGLLRQEQERSKDAAALVDWVVTNERRLLEKNRARAAATRSAALWRQVVAAVALAAGAAVLVRAAARRGRV